MNRLTKLTLISLVEIVYVVYMLRCFKTRYSLAHPLVKFNEEYLKHPIGKSSIPQSTICQFGHDGAIIIQNDLIDSAACILPLTESKMIDPEMGTRHRAALGITEETDAIVILISEEKSKISVAEDGKFVHVGLDEISLRKYLNDSMFISSGD